MDERQIAERGGHSSPTTTTITTSCNNNRSAALLALSTIIDNCGVGVSDFGAPVQSNPDSEMAHVRSASEHCPPGARGRFGATAAPPPPCQEVRRRADT